MREGQTNEVERYNIPLNVWQHAPPMRDSRMYHAAVAASDDTIVVCSGSGVRDDISSCEIFSSSSKRYIPHFKHANAYLNPFVCMYVCMYLLIGKGQSAQKRPYWGEDRIKRKIYE